MLASASGPLGALLVIAPLAAIPVVAIVGIPQFAPVSASPNEEEEIGEPGESVAAPAAPRLSKPRSADDLFAPMPGSGPNAQGGQQFTSVYGNQNRSEHPSRLGNQSQFDAAFDSTDNWEVVSPDPRNTAGNGSGAGRDGRNAGAGVNLLDSLPRDARERQGRGSSSANPAPPSVSGGVDANGFKAGLLPNVHPKDAGRLDEMKRPGAGDRSIANPAAPRGDSRTMNDFPADANFEAMQQMMMSEQSRWQAAATRIKQLRIQKYRLEAKIEEPRFVFRCVFAPAESSQVTQLFEADAETPIDAVEQVLQQVDEWLSSHDQTAALLLD